MKPPHFSFMLMALLIISTSCGTQRGTQKRAFFSGYQDDATAQPQAGANLSIGVVKTTAGVAGVRDKADKTLKPTVILKNDDIVVFRETQVKDWVLVEIGASQSDFLKVGPLWVNQSQLTCGPQNLCLVSSEDGFANGRGNPSLTGPIIRVLHKNGVVQLGKKVSGNWVEVTHYLQPQGGRKLNGWMPKEFLILNPTSVVTSPKPKNDSVELNVPYYSQLDNYYEPHSTCGITSASMLLAFNKKNLRADDLYEMYGKDDGQSPGTLADLYRSALGQGAKIYSTTQGSFEDIKSYLRRGQPVVTHGYFTRSGHVILIVGYNERGFVVHDPYGQWLGNEKYDIYKSGRSLTYSYSSLREVMGEDGDVWFSTAVAPNL